MKKIDSVNNSKAVLGLLSGLKSRITSTKPLLTMLALLMVALFGVNESAWGGTWYAKINASADPSNGGYVFVGTSSSCSANNATSSTHSAENSASKSFKTSGDVNLWLCAKAKSGYIFKGWNTDQSNTVLSGSTAVPYKVTVHGTAKVFGIGGESYNYYAIFARLAANTPAAGSTTSFDDTNVGEESGWEQIKIDHAHAGTVTISQSGNDGDFFVGATTGATTELSSFESTTETTRTLYVKFVPQNNGLRTCTLTVSSNNGLSSLTYYLSGTGYNEPSITWVDGNGSELVSGETTLSAGDVLRASCTTGQSVSYSDFNSSYFTAGTDGEGNPILTVREDISGTINNLSVTANLAKNTSTYYAAYSEAFTLNVTNLTPQEIEWTDDIADLSNENMPYTITLSAVAKNAKTGAASGLPVTYSMASNASLSLSGNVLTVRALGGPVAITASVAGNESYAPASVTKYATVINMTDPCATSDNHSGGTLNRDNKNFDIYPTVPKQLTFRVTKSSSLFLADLEVIQYNASGTQLEKTTIGYGDISTSGTNRSINCNANTTRIRFNAGAYLGYSYTISNVQTTRNTTSSVSVNSLSYSTDPGQSLGKQITVTYSNIPVFLSFKSDEDAGVSSGKSLWSVNTSYFGGCGKKGSQTVTVTFRSNAKGNYTDKLYVRNNVGTLLHTIDLSASVTAQEQFLKSWNIADAYNTTDQVTLQASTTVDNTDFTFTATTSNPANIVSISNAGVMTFSGSGTATIRAYQPGDAMSQEFETTHDITVNKVSPNITNPTGKAIEYRSALKNSTWEEAGVAKVTLRGVPNTVVAGSFGWNDPEHVVMDAAGEHSYKATFTPSDGGMYNNVEYDQTITILRTAQTLEMNNGAVKIAVDGIDAGKADSKIDLDNLIKSQTSDIVNNNERTGAVTYEVISENKANADIAAGNIFSARVIGDYRIRATKAQTNWYNEVTDEFVVTVSKRANTMVISGTSFERFVDQEVTNVRDVQNSDAEVQTSSDFPTIAYYDVANNKIVIPNSESDDQMFGSQKTVTIKIWQEETERFEASGEKTITLTVKKYETTKSGEDITLKVNETVTGNYSFTNTSAEYPSNNLNDDFYYTIDAPSFDNEALNNGDQLITYNPSENEITGHNAGTTKITFFQKETYKYTGATLMCNVTVEKRDNQLSNSWGNNVWQKAMNESASLNVSFTSTHGDYANYPISIDRIYGEDVATLTGDAAGATITTNTTKGYAIWHVSQAENYEYYSAEADVIVTVGVPAPPTCYVYQDNSEHEFGTGIGDAEGHFTDPIAINSPVDKIWFNAKRQLAGVNKFVVQYSKDNGKNWSTLLSPSLDTKYKSSAFSATFPTMQGTERITNVRFGAKTGATLSKWYKDVQISRRAYLNLQDAEKNKISKLPTMTCTLDETSTATAKFYIDYSTCADEIIIESSDPEHFTVSESAINVSDKHDNLLSAKKEITVTYHSTELGTHNAVITVRTSYQTRVLSVSGETTKRTPELIWQEGYTNNPLTLPVGLTVNAINPAATTTSTALIKYESSDESVVEIIENGYAFRIIKAGSAVLTATAPENDKWKEVSDTRVINATDKIVQEIVWNQSFPRFMEPGDVIDLDAKVYLRNLTTNALIYSAERTSCINYTCPTNNGIVSVSGNKMTVLDYGEVKVTASVGGNADYAAAASVIMLINVRQPSVGCETPLVLNRTDIIDMFEVDVDFSDYFNLTTEEMVSGEIAIDHANGKPDKLSFQYAGEEFNAYLKKYFGGFIKFEQHVNGSWIAVTNSRVETVKNEWNTKSNLQLDENADALRIIREKGGTGHHYIKDIQVTRKQYLRETNSEINLGEIKIGQATPVTIGFDYSDVKGDLTARTINNTTDLTIKDNGVIDLECGSFGHYDLQVTFTPSKDGDWQGTVEVYDNIANLSITVTLTATVTASEEYIFDVAGDWNNSSNWTTNLVPDENADITVAKDMIISSAANVKSITIEKGVTVTVKKGITLKIGNGVPKSRTTYGNLYVEDGAQVIVKDGGILNINNFTLEASIGGNGTPASSGQVGGEGDLDVNGEVYFQISFDPSGAISYGWYDFTVPFEVDVLNGIFDKDGNKLTNRVDYAIMDFSEAKRAVNGKHWNWFSGTLQPGTLYSITLEETKTWNTFLFKRKTDVDTFGSNVYGASCSDGGAKKDCGWNGMGNGTLRYCQLNNLPDQTKVLVYDHINDRYMEREAADYTYAVGTAFFVQVDEAKNIDLTTVTEQRAFLAPARERRSVEEFRLALTEEGNANVADYMWVSASEEATGEYVIGRDLLKMGTPTQAKVAQMWSTNNGLTLCDIEMPLVNNEANCTLGLYAPKAGIYELTVDRAPEDADLYLTYNGEVIWDLTASPYVFDLAKGTTEGYGLRIAARAPQIATGVDETDADGKSVRKVVINDKIYLITPEGKMYDIIGKSVKY